MRRVAPVLCLAFLIASPLLAQRALTPLDVVTMKSVAGAFPSPDGSRIAFTRSEPRGPTAPPGAAYTALYVLDAGGERALVAGAANVGGVAWRPDGSAATFVERREGDAGRQLYAIPMRGGAPERVFATDLSIGTFRWRPDGGAVAFTASPPAPPARAAARARGFTQTVVDEDWNPTNLYVWTPAAGVRQLDVPGSVFDVAWSPDGTRLALALAPRPLVDDSYMFKRIHVLDVAAGAVRRLVDNPGKLGAMAWSPDGTRLAYVSAEDARDPHAGMLYLADARTGAVTPLTEGFEGMVHDLLWLDDARVRAVVSRGIESSVADLDVRTRRWTDLTINKLRVEDVEMAGRAVAAVMSGPAHPSEVYTLAGGTWTRRTNSNPWLDDVALTRQAIHRFTASDSVTIEGILLYPRDFREGTRYPLVIVAHGGPESHYGNQWVTTYSEWGQLLSRDGYFVWYPNYRSSTGRGVAFAKADHGDPMGREFQDHLDAIDDFVRRGWVDRARVGIGGGSYGGYTAAWAATRHTDHFAAAVAFVPITWVPGLVLASDIPREFYYVHYEEQWPHQAWDFMEERSPLTHAPNTRTPLFIAGGTSDPRVHPSQPFMLYRAVETSTDTPVRYIQYPGEGHGNRTNVFRYDFTLRTLRWFQHYLRPGDHRRDAPPPQDVDYGAWLGAGT
jgi:dipeptidyl aminopeptidase/acylaminoacyl peptidase